MSGDNGDLKKEEPKEEVKQEQKPPEPPKDAKIAEIWIRSGEIQFDAIPYLYQDKIRTIGILEYCKDIVKNYTPPKPKIIPARHEMIDGVRNFFRRK